MERRTETPSDGSQKSLILSSEGRPAWQISTLSGSSTRPSRTDPGINGPVLEKQQSASGLTERDYIGLAENPAFEQPSSADVKKDDELSLGEADLHLELELGLGTASSRKSDCEHYTGFLLKQKDGELKSQKEWTPKNATPVESSRYGFPEAATTFQKAWQNARPATADGLNSSNGAAQEYLIPNKVLVFAQDLEEGPSRAGLSTFYGPNVKNGTKRGYTEAMHDARIPVGKVEAKMLPKHHQAPFLSKLLSTEPSASAHWVVGPEKSSTHALVPRKEKMITENAPLPFNSPKDCNEPRTNDPPPPKGQVVGWPPVPSYRKQNIAKPTEMYVKVNMDGMTVGRKVDLNAHSSYEGLYLTLEEMFQPSNNGGQGTLQSLQGRESHVYDGKQIRLLNGLEYVLTYEDEDGDWMMAGDFPWDMFVKTVRRLRITRTSEATGLAPTIK